MSIQTREYIIKNAEQEFLNELETKLWKAAGRELGDDILEKITVEITEKLRKSTTFGWQVKESVRAELRILIRRTLQRWNSCRC